MAASKSVVVFVLIAAVAIASVSASCPNLKTNSSCNTGNCASGGVVSKWKIPSIPNLPCTVLPCKYTGVFMYNGQKVVSDYDVSSPAACCKTCKKKKTTCKYWQWAKVPGKCNSCSSSSTGVCFLYSESPPSCGGSVENHAGGKCTNPEVNGDPHLVGAHGTHFDFSGAPEESFCLVTDRNLHMNMKMTGYLDERTESATLMKDGKAVRTWIRELGILWTVEGVEHSLRLVARESGETARGLGYLASAEMDGVVLPNLQPGNDLMLGGGLVFKMEAVEKKGPFDVDFYTVKIADLLDMDVRVRVAQKELQRPSDAEAHISISINDITATEAIHGVLGQTYRSDRDEKAMEYSKIGALLHHSIAADGESGKGFLDGRVTDYVSSGVLAADCRYTGYAGHVLPTTVSSE